VRRPSLALPAVALVVLVTVSALAGCRTEPSVAAYVGDRQISNDQLADAIDQRMADDNISAVVETGDPGYQRLVLSQLIQQAVYRIMSQKYGVTVSDRDVDVKLDELLADAQQDIEAVYAQLAAEQRLSEIDVRENVRQALTREQIASREGLDGPIRTAALRERYEEVKDQLSTIELGFITVPDQQTADETLAAVLADPASYSELAATYAGPYTQPSLVSSPVSEVPSELVPSVLQTGVGQGFTVAVPRTGGIVVGYVAALEVPPFVEVEDQIRVEASSGVDAAVGDLVTAFVADLEFDINPRYGTFDQGQVVPAGDGGVVRILEDAGTA